MQTRTKHNKLNAVSLQRHALLERMSQTAMPQQASETKHWLYQGSLFQAASNYLFAGDRTSAARILRQVDRDIRRYLLADLSNDATWLEQLENLISITTWPSFPHSICCHTCKDVTTGFLEPDGFVCQTCHKTTFLTPEDSVHGI